MAIATPEISIENLPRRLWQLRAVSSELGSAQRIWVSEGLLITGYVHVREDFGNIQVVILFLT